MVGRAYTMKEMKQIVNYLVEHRAYAEIRGRKMWIDLASSKIIDRTWQSLKETFLKRILPDIHNPYYKLTVEQIASFRQESDIEAKNRNKLEIQTISDDSNSSDNRRVNEEAMKKADENTGEDKGSKTINHPRSSTDTLVLENCYETAEDIQNVLESPKNTHKSLRDFITYSEPLTPMLQEVIDDFASDDEPQLQIVEEPDEIVVEINNAANNKSKSPETIRESQSYTKKTEDVTGEGAGNQNPTSKIKSLKLKKTQKGTWENKELVNDVSTTTKKTETENNDSKITITGKEDPTNPKISIVEKSASPDKNNSTTDTPLPNNQEELAEKPNETGTSSDKFLEPQKKSKEKALKRSRSQSSGERKKKRVKSRNWSESRDQENTQTFNSHPHTTSLLKELANGTITIQESGNKENNITDDTNISPNVVVENKADKSNEGTSQEAGPSVGNAKSPADINPCLKSVSLFAEQYSQAKYLDSDEEGASQGDKNQDEIKPIENNHEQSTNKNQHVNDASKETNLSNQSKVVVVRNSTSNHSELPSTSRNFDLGNILLYSRSETSSSNNFEAPKKRNSREKITKRKSKEKVLANLFGFASGGACYKKTLNHSKTNSRQVSHRRRLNSRNITYNVESGSSDSYTTASDSEDARAPSASGRHGRHSRRYIKPPSYEFLSHENGMFVVGRKKLYPLLLRENGTLNYACSNGKYDDENDSFWKAKYLDEKKKLSEEKIRADELARLLKKAKDLEKARESSSPILQSNLTSNTSASQSQSKEEKEEVHKEREPTKPEERVKIKFNKNKEIELECPWSNINPILERMVQIFKTNDLQDEAKANQESNAKTEGDKDKAREENVEKVTETNATPKKIVRGRKAKSVCEIRINDSNDKDDVESSKGKSEEALEISSGKTTPLVATSDPEVRKIVDEREGEIFEKIVEMDKAEQSAPEAKGTLDDTNVTKRKRGRPKKLSPVARSSASIDTDTTKSSVKEAENGAGPSKRLTKAPRRFGSESNLATASKVTKSRLSLHKPDEMNGADVSVPEDDQVRYMLPPKTRILTRAYKSNRSSTNEPKLTSPDSNSRHSESTQGYHDSDISPPSLPKKKRRMSAISFVYKKNLVKRVKRKSCPYLADIDDSCSTNESHSQKSETAPTDSHKLNSKVYTSESYQILMSKTKQLSQLDKIDENPSQNEEVINKKSLNNITPLTTNINDKFYILSDEIQTNLSEPKRSEGNSSNASSLLSPELSVVENLCVSKDLISSSLEDHPSINETQANDVVAPTENYSKYFISNVDVSMPLMGQDCEFQSRYENKPRDRRTTFSESLVQEQLSSESLDQRLRNLLLESAKKMEGPTEIIDVENFMEVDTIVASSKEIKPKKRRSSTPCKKKGLKRVRTPDVGPVIEEHTESCSRGGRKSCPPIIRIDPSAEIAVNIDSDLNNEHINTQQRGRKKKDVIKVKILRPRARSCSKEKPQVSLLTDSGINNTESGASEGCECCDVSTELIHNHSDTCLHMDECVGDSVELVENMNPSVISLNSSSFPSEIYNQESKDSKDSAEEFVTPESFCSNAREATNLNSVKKLTQRDASDTGTVYHTPNSSESCNSLITEDLSDENRSPSITKWYLLNEEMTNFADTHSQPENTSVGSNLNQIFTSCAVPDLSTISERSKENDTKTMLNTDPDSDAVSQSIFDVDF